MKREYSCGSVVYKKENNEYYFLIVKHKYGTHYSFPKGHIEQGETKEETAIREVLEETGININLNKEYYDTTKYSFKINEELIEKEVTYFLAEAKNTDLKKQETEISEVLWVHYNDVFDILTFAADKKIFENITNDLMNRKNRSKRRINIIEFMVVILASLFIVTIPDFLKWNYWIKSIIKITMFLAVPLVYLCGIRKIKLNFIKLNKKRLLESLITGFIIYGLIIIGYLILRNHIDFSNIGNELSKIGVTKNNFIFVGLYIPLVNAFLEEFFFRGIILNGLELKIESKYASILSALLFANYHVLIISGWSGIYITIGAIIGLFFVGLFFNYIVKKTKSIIPTYLIHMFANLAINTVALFVLGIL